MARARARARARLFSRLRNFAGGNASEKFKKTLHCLDSASLFRTVSFSFLPMAEEENALLLEALIDNAFPIEYAFVLEVEDARQK